MNNKIYLLEDFFPEIKDKNMLDSIKKLSHFIEMKKGQTLFVENDTLRSIYFIFSGYLKTMRKHDSQERLISRIFSAGEIIGVREYYTKKKFSRTAEALSSAQILALNEKSLDKLRQEYPELTERFAVYMGLVMEDLEHKHESLRFLSVKAKVADGLLNLQKIFSNSNEIFDHPFQRNELCQLFGVSLASLNRSLQELSKAGFIVFTATQIEIKDKSSLLSLCQDELE